MGCYKSVAYPAVSTTLPEGYSMGFVPWFLVLWFLQPKKSTCMQLRFRVGFCTTHLQTFDRISHQLGHIHNVLKFQLTPQL